MVYITTVVNTKSMIDLNEFINYETAETSVDIKSNFPPETQTNTDIDLEYNVVKSFEESVDVCESIERSRSEIKKTIRHGLCCDEQRKVKLPLGKPLRCNKCMKETHCGHEKGHSFFETLATQK